MKKFDITNEQLLIAHDDYDSAKFLFDNKVPKPLEIICYHCQQAAEKSLKAFICTHDIEIPKTHEVKRLCAICADIDSTFKDLFPECEELEVYATETRYPLRIEIDSSHAEKALNQALKIYNFVSDKIHKYFDEIEVQLPPGG